MTRPLTPQEHARVAEAIRAAERRTSGEIFCVMARASDSHFYPAAFVLAAATLVASLIAALVLEAWWISLPTSLFVVAQGLAFLLGLVLLTAFPALRIRLTPKLIAWRHAHRHAMQQFLSRNIHLTENRTGVLIFVSLAERYAEVVADARIDARVGQEDWNGVVATLTRHAAEDRLADGFVAAIAQVAALLETHFPPEPHDRNELDDHLVEI